MKKVTHFVGVDLGGTKILAVAYNREGKILAEEKEATLSTGGDPVFKQLTSLIRKVQDKAELPVESLGGVGVGIPGTLDFDKGVIRAAANLGLSDFPLRSRLEEEFKAPAFVENDVNAGIYGELVHGAAKGAKHVVGLFIGTGIGGGLIQNGKLFRGSHGGAGEIGHMVIQYQGPRCSCGRFGCLEAICSRGALSREIAALAAVGLAPSVFEKAGSDFRKIKSKHIVKSYELGEEAVVNAIHRSADFMGVGLANCVYLYDPEVLVLGGGLIEKLGDRYVKRASAAMVSQFGLEMPQPVRVTAAQLGDYSVIEGAVSLLKESLPKGK